MKTFLLTSTNAIVLLIIFLSLPTAWSDDDWREHSDLREQHLKSVGVAGTDSPLYKEECGDCHMAYPAGLLPASSWQRIMNNLQDHFGDNAEVDIADKITLENYLQKNSANNTDYRRSKAIMKSSYDSNTPIRITKLRYFLHEHDEIPNRYVSQNKQVRSFSHCNACHQYAERGSFSEREISIPGYGAWDD